MRVHIQLLHHQNEVRRALHGAGWRLHKSADGIVARHPLVADRESARHRLHELGLLTSGSVRIHFPVGAAAVDR